MPESDHMEMEQLHDTELQQTRRLDPAWRLSAWSATVVAAIAGVGGLVFATTWEEPAGSAGALSGLGELVGALMAAPAVVALLLLGFGAVAASDGSTTWAKGWFSLGFCVAGFAGIIGLAVLGS